MRAIQLLGALVLLMLTCAPAMAASKAAASVIFALGEVSAVDKDGVTRVLAKGDEIFAGDTVNTARGKAHLRFTDGGFAALNPNTRYQIEEYLDEGRPNVVERSFHYLFGGSVRFVTGAIGHRLRENFRLRTPVATIGIRGSDGFVRHCVGDCPGQEDGTYVSGDGLTITSGSFEGPLYRGDSFHCTGGGCTALEGPVAQRAELSVLDINSEPAEDPFVATAYGADGVQCNLGGGCGSGAASAPQVGAIVGGNFNAAGTFLVMGGSSGPTAFITSSESTSGASSNRHLDILTVDAENLAQAFDSVTDPDLRDALIATLSEAQANHADLFASLKTNPAEIAPEDFGPTSDGLLTKGRFQQGALLSIANNITTNLSSGTQSNSLFADLQTLNGFQGIHFIYGADPGAIEFFGSATYTFSGGTFSTDVDGAALGEGVTGGSINWHFGLNLGLLDMTLSHGGTVYRVAGNLYVPESGDPRLIEDLPGEVFVSVGGSLLPNTADIHGFFAGDNASGLPQAIGLNYLINTANPILGAVGFGLTSSQSHAGSTVLPNGSFTAYGNAYIDVLGRVGFLGAPAGTLYGGFGSQISDGVRNRVILGSFLAAIDSDGPDPYCTVQTCVFIGAGSSIAETGSNATFGVTWNRFTGDYFAQSNVNYDGSFAPQNRGDFHAIYSTIVTPTSGFPGGTLTYNSLIGGTSPTHVFGSSGQSQEVGTHTVSVTINYGLGDVTNVNISGTFLSASVLLSTSNAVPIGSPIAINPLAGDTAQLTAAGFCASGCQMAGGIELIPVGASAGGVVGSYGASTGLVGGIQHAVNGTFLVVP
jgi:FecR protein